MFCCFCLYLYFILFYFILLLLLLLLLLSVMLFLFCFIVIVVIAKLTHCRHSRSSWSAFFRWSSRRPRSARPDGRGHSCRCTSARWLPWLIEKRSTDTGCWPSTEKGHQILVESCWIDRKFSWVQNVKCLMNERNHRLNRGKKVYGRGKTENML